MFDTIGTLYGTASQAGMLDKNGDPEDLDKCMACDSIATVTGAVLGTSTCTTFVESASGLRQAEELVSPAWWFRLASSYVCSRPRWQV